MVTTRLAGRQLGPRTSRGRRRRAITATTFLALVVMVRVVLGVWVAATVLGVAVVAGLLAGWAAVEARAFGPHHPPAGPVPVQSSELRGADHVAFARGLAALAAAYLAHCERHERER